jgi:hypothetical protein
MATTDATATPELRTKGAFEERPDSSLYDFASALDLGKAPSSREVLTQREQAGERQARGYEAAADEGTKTLETLTREAVAQHRERQAAKPPPLTLADPPSTAARAFLQPGDSLLGQFQTAMLGIGNMVLQGKGLHGSAMAATVAMKGMAEGWQQGDAERVKREYTTWQTQTDKLLTAHRLARESYEDLLTDHKQSWDSILAQTRVRAEIAGNKALAEAARSGSIDAVLKWHQDTAKLELQHERFRAELARWHAEAARHEATEKRLEDAAAEARRTHKAHEDAEKKRAAERTRMNDLRAPLLEMPALALKSAKENMAIDNRLREVTQLEAALKITVAAGVTPTGRDIWDQTGASIAAKLKTDPNLGPAIDTIERIGTALLVGRELALGQTASTMRIKEIVSKEAGNVLGATKGFWEQELPIYRKQLQAQKHLNDQYLSIFKAAERLAAPAMQDDPDNLEIISTTP